MLRLRRVADLRRLAADADEQVSTTLRFAFRFLSLFSPFFSSFFRLSFSLISGPDPNVSSTRNAFEDRRGPTFYFAHYCSLSGTVV